MSEYSPTEKDWKEWDKQLSDHEFDSLYEKVFPLNSESPINPSIKAFGKLFVGAAISELRKKAKTKSTFQVAHLAFDPNAGIESVAVLESFLNLQLSDWEIIAMFYIPSPVRVGDKIIPGQLKQQEPHTIISDLV